VQAVPFWNPSPPGHKYHSSITQPHKSYSGPWLLDVSVDRLFSGHR
jgi:hypothetical protein